MALLLLSLVLVLCCSTANAFRVQKRSSYTRLFSTAAPAAPSKTEPKETWTKVALAEPVESVETWSFSAKSIINTNINGGEKKERLDAFAKIKGTYYINGLGSILVGSRLVHPFEAHGFIKSIELHGNGSATYRSRYIETPCTSIERSLNVNLFRGVMSRPFAAPFTFLNAFSPQERNTANLACRIWNVDGTEKQQLIVGGDNGSPYVLDPTTLKTEGRLADIGRKTNFKDLDGKKLLAHTRYDSARNRLLMSACTFVLDKPGDPGKVSLQFWEYDRKGNLLSEREHKTDFMVVHDWTITDNYYIVPKNPAEMNWPNLANFLLGTLRGVDVFNMDTNTSGSILLIPRHNESEPVLEVTADTFFTIFHLGPTYEQTNEENEKELVMHGVVFDHYEFGKEMGFNVDLQELDPTRWSTSKEASPPRLDRFVIDIATGLMKARSRISLLDAQGLDVPVDMPTFHPKRDGKQCRFCYFTGGNEDGWFPFRSLVKADLHTGQTEVWNAGLGKVVSEPLFIPSISVGAGGQGQGQGDEEDDGFVVSVLSNSNDERCELAVFDARDFGAGPIALLELGALAPWSIHGHWVPSA